MPGLGDAEQHELWLSEEVLLQRRKNQLEGQLRISPHEFLALAGCRSRSGALLTYYSSSSMLACGAHVKDQEALSKKQGHFPTFSSTVLRLLSFQPRSGHHHFPSRSQFPGKRACIPPQLNDRQCDWMIVPLKDNHFSQAFVVALAVKPFLLRKVFQSCFLLRQAERLWLVAKGEALAFLSAAQRSWVDLLSVAAGGGGFLNANGRAGGFLSPSQAPALVHPVVQGLA